MERFMMATKALHKLGDISRNPADLCVIDRENKENFIGNWVTGYGFIDVNFQRRQHGNLPRKKRKNITEHRLQSEAISHKPLRQRKILFR